MIFHLKLLIYLGLLHNIISQFHTSKPQVYRRKKESLEYPISQEEQELTWAISRRVDEDEVQCTTHPAKFVFLFLQVLPHFVEGLNIFTKKKN